MAHYPRERDRGIMSETAEITQWLSEARDGIAWRWTACCRRFTANCAWRGGNWGNQNGHTLDATGLVHEAICDWSPGRHRVR
jgi:hypothetical protein